MCAAARVRTAAARADMGMVWLSADSARQMWRVYVLFMLSK